MCQARCTQTPAAGKKKFWERDWLPAAQPRASQSEGARAGLHINPEKFKEEDFTAQGGRLRKRNGLCPSHCQPGEFWLQPAGLLSWCSQRRCCSGMLTDQKCVLPVIYGTEDPASHRLGGRGTDDWLAGLALFPMGFQSCLLHLMAEGSGG